MHDCLTTGDYPAKDPTPIIPLTNDATDLANTSKQIPVFSLSQMQIEYNNSEYNDCVDDEKYLTIPIVPKVCSIKEKNKESSWLETLGRYGYQPVTLFKIPVQVSNT